MIFLKKESFGRNLLSVCLAFTFLASLLISPFSAAAAETMPDLTVTAVGVDGAYVELGLNIQAGTNGFRSVGAVVSYDTSLLAPVSWAETPVSIVLTDVPEDTDYTEEEARLHWNTFAAALPAKGPDELSGKTALAYNMLNGSGYVYLSAEAPRLIEGGAETDGAITGGWNQPLPENAALTEGDPAADVLTSNGVPVYLPTAEKTETPVEQSVVVRFRLKAGVEMDAALASIDVAKGAAASGSPIFDESGAAYFCNDYGEQLEVNLKILRVKSGTTYYSGGAGGGGVNMDGILSVAFYDWDETLLGILAVPAGEDISERVNSYARMFIHPALNDLEDTGETQTADERTAMLASNERKDTYRGKHPSLYGDNDTIDLTGSGYPLTNKLDYVFYKGDTTAEDYDGFWFAHGWIPVTTATLDGRAENGVFTAYATADDAAAANPVDFSAGLSESIMVKAAYVAGKDLKTGANNAAEKYYTVTNVAYNRYGTASATAGSYSMIATIERINADGYGVTRLRNPAFRMYVTPDAGDSAQAVVVRVDVEGKDEVTAEIVAPRMSTQTNMQFIDVTAVNWVDLGVYSTTEEITRDKKYNDDGELEHLGYLILGTVKAVNDAVKELDAVGSISDTAANNAYSDIVNDQTYADLESTLSRDLLGVASRYWVAAARHRLLLGYAANCKQEMDFEYIKGVLAMDLNTPNITTATNYNKALANINTALAANNNQPLTVEQAAYAINNGGSLPSAE